VPLNTPQQLFLDQARSDYEIYDYLSRKNNCHRLHYLQMCTEKLAKVYFWRHGHSPGLNHFVLVRFLLDLDPRPDFHQMFGYVDRQRFDLQKASIFDLAQRLQDLAPAGGNSGPNPEYPWPPRATSGPKIGRRASSPTFPIRWTGWFPSFTSRRRCGSSPTPGGSTRGRAPSRAASFSIEPGWARSRSSPATMC